MVQDLDQDWDEYFTVDVSDVVVEFAGLLAEKHALRGADAIHLASATLAKQAGENVVFFGFDGRPTLPARRTAEDRK